MLADNMQTIMQNILISKQISTKNVINELIHLYALSLSHISPKDDLLPQQTDCAPTGPSPSCLDVITG